MPSPRAWGFCAFCSLGGTWRRAALRHLGRAAARRAAHPDCRRDRADFTALPPTFDLHRILVGRHGAKVALGFQDRNGVLICSARLDARTGAAFARAIAWTVLKIVLAGIRGER